MKKKKQVPLGLWIYLAWIILSASYLLIQINEPLVFFVLIVDCAVIYSIFKRKKYTPLILAGQYFIIYGLTILGLIILFLENDFPKITATELIGLIAGVFIAIIWIKYFYSKKEYFTEP